MPQPAVSSIEGEINAFNQAVANPTNYVLNSSLGSDATVRGVACDPGAFFARQEG
jgi:iron complex outermembrane recepter protein